MKRVGAVSDVKWLIIRGALDSASFPPWVFNHCRRLGVACQQVQAGPTQATFRVEGQPELIDALEVGCLLGPFDIWVESIEKRGFAPSE